MMEREWPLKKRDERQANLCFGTNYFYSLLQDNLMGPNINTYQQTKVNLNLIELIFSFEKREICYKYGRKINLKDITKAKYMVQYTG
jgi:hypothetical protein